MAGTTLAEIQQKVRRLTRSPSETILSNSELDQYINTAVLYDLPEYLRLRDLKTTVTWYTQAYQDVYPVDQSISVNDPLYDFQNKYVTIDTPCYIAGNRSFYTQSRDVFYGAYPQTSFIENVAVGDGSATIFDGTLTNVPVLQNSVIVSSIDANNVTYTYIDQPVLGSVQDGNLLNASTRVSQGTINYITGDWLIEFESAPADEANIALQSVPYTPTVPSAVLYFSIQKKQSDSLDPDIIYTNQMGFVVRPVPDGAYAINLEAYRLPTELLNSGDSPDLKQWWQYIAYLAAKKIFEDRMDMDSVQQITPELIKQESLVLSRTYVQNATQRNATIYSPQLENSPYFGSWGWWNTPLG